MCLCQLGYGPATPARASACQTQLRQHPGDVVGAHGRIEQAWRNVKATGHVARVLTELGLAS